MTTTAVKQQVKTIDINAKEDMYIILKGSNRGLFGRLPFTNNIDLAMVFYDEPPDEVLKTWNPLLKAQIGKDFSFECVEL